MSTINLENYRNGLIKGYELAYQDEDWYEKNKNNFCNSMRKNYPELVPKYVEKSKYEIKNFLAFNPDDLIRFGKLEVVSMKFGDEEVQFWVSKIPEGMSLYHSSRALGLNHSDFPLIGYSNYLNKKENLQTSSKLCPNESFIGKSSKNVENVCTYVSYYSTPYLTKGYLKQSSGFGGNAVKYAYGITPFQKERDNKLYNDRLRYKATLEENEIRVSEQTAGISSYKTKEDTYLFIFGLDDILIDRPNLGKRNLKNFFDAMEYLKTKIVSEFKISEEVYEKFLDLILSVGGIGSLQDNIDNLKKDYSISENFEKNLKSWLERNAQHYLENPLPTAGLISKFPEIIQSGLKNIPGLRFSTFEHDRPVMNMLSWLFKTFSTYSESGKKIEIAGFVSSSLYVYSKGKGDVTKGRNYSVQDLVYYSPKGYFHSELGLFFAPNNLERDRNNKYDNEYSINYLGINQEYRKFKTTNLLPGKNFHQGHLLEHNTWVGLVASNLYTRFTKYNSEEIATKDVYLLAGYLHDLGKSGECEVKPVYSNLNHQDARMSVCNYVFDDNEEIVGFRYHSLPAHPEEGYEYMKGYKPYKRFTLEGRKSIPDFNKAAQKIYSEDWEKFFDHLKIDNFYRRMIRITAGAHWYFGDAIRKLTLGGNKKELAKKYLRQVEIFYNDEFFKLKKKDFKKIVIFVIIISIADIFGSEYDPQRKNTGLTEDEVDTLINYLPNISLDEIEIHKRDSSSKIVTKIIEKALVYQGEATHKRKIFEELREKSEGFLDECLNLIDTEFEFNPNNNYSLLFNLRYSYPFVTDIKKAYTNSFPKAIVFDLDQTLVAAKFYSDRPVEYHIYPETEKVIQEVQKLRKETKIVLITRHYSPKPLLKLLQSETYEGKKNPIYYKNFDLIVARYTGSQEIMKQDLKRYPNFFEMNGYPNEGFIMDNTGEFYYIPNNSNFLDLDKASKNGHFDLVRKKFGIKYSDIINFDDDEKYFENGKGLGKAKDVFVAGVLTSSNVENQGIRYNLFKDGVAFYVFNKLKKNKT
jgi:hypothetical protein